MEKEYVVPGIEHLGPVIEELKADTSGLILFYGNLGAGKTTLITRLCRSLGVEEDISSPTFSIVNEYRGRDRKIFHFDLYRIKEPSELFDFGFEEYLDQGALCLVEWPQVAESFLPKPSLEVHIEYSPNSARIIRTRKNV